MSKTFDAVSWMREQRERIDAEDAGLSWEARSRKTAEVVENDPIWTRLKGRRLKASPLRSEGGDRNRK